MSKYSDLDTISKSGKRYELYGREVYTGAPIAKDSERFTVYEGYSSHSFTSVARVGTYRQALKIALKIQREGKWSRISDRLIEDEVGDAE